MKLQTKRKIGRAFFNMDIFTPRGFFLRAILIFLIFAVFDIAGLGKYAMILSGTAPSGVPENFSTQFFSVLYILFYLGAVILAPILFIASGILRILFYLTEPYKKP